LVTSRSSSGHGLAATGVDGTGAAAELDEEPAAIGGGVDGAGAVAGLDEELACGDGDCAAGLMSTEHPAIRTTPSKGSIHFMFMPHSSPVRLHV
jgi:hypothetical protein